MSFFHFFQKTICYLRSCPVCSASSPTVQWLCPYCWAKLKSYYLNPKDMIRVQNGLTHIRLFDWHQENDFFIRRFLNSLKKGAPFFVFDELIKELLHRIISVRSLPLNYVIVPAPAEGPYVKDHAFYIANSLSALSGHTVKTLLSRVQKDGSQSRRWKQRLKNKTERKKVYFHLKEYYACKNYIFVDDILTTGATAFAAYRVLRKPSSFLIVTLAWRHIL